MEILLIFFIILAIVSSVGIVFLYLTKNFKSKTRLFYFLAIWSLLITLINATSLPSNYLISQLIAWSFGFISIIAIIIKVKNPQKANLPNLLVAISILCGLIDLFFIK